MAKCWPWGFYIPKVHPRLKKKKKMRKNQHVRRLRFSLNTNKHKYPKNCPLIIARPTQLHETVQQKCYCTISYETTRKQSRSGATPYVRANRVCFDSRV